MLRNVEYEWAKVWPRLNAKKTETMLFNQDNVVDIKLKYRSKTEPGIILDILVDGWTAQKRILK